MTFPVTDTGPAVADDAHTVVLLHGFPQNRESWQDVSARLNQAGLRTLAPDLRGLPEGARPRRRRDYRVERLVEDVDALLDAAGLASAHLVGHDWGAGIAWEVALRRPKRVLSLTVLSTPHPSALLWSMLRSAQGLRSWYMLALQLPALPETWIARSLRRDGLRSSISRRSMASPSRSNCNGPGRSPARSHPTALCCFGPRRSPPAPGSTSRPRPPTCGPAATPSRPPGRPPHRALLHRPVSLHRGRRRSLAP